jgi:hypothetical protein
VRVLTAIGGFITTTPISVLSRASVLAVLTMAPREQPSID